jgi:PPIC-type PPIASE domain
MKIEVRRLLGGLAVLFFATYLTDCFSQVRALARTMPSGPIYGPTLRLRHEVVAPAGSTVDHSLFYSSYLGEENRIVARTRHGDITARDLYLWLTVRDTPTRPNLLEQLDKAKTETQRKALTKQVQQEISEYVFTNFVIPGLMGNAPCDETAAYKAHIYTLPAYQLVYLLKLIQPEVCITEGDRVKYLRDHKSEIAPSERRRVQYIFMPSSEKRPIEEQDEVESALYEIRDTKAPSAPNGGEIPPFGTGELFFMFENAAAGLQPGEISEPFRGPRGFYMVRLLETLPTVEPTLQDPVQAQKVDEGLGRQVLRAQYTYERSDLFLRRKAVYQHTVWDERRDCDTVGVIRDFGITKEQFRAVFPAVEDDKTLTRRDDLITKYIRSMLEREAMAQEVVEAGLISDPMLARAGWMAENMTRRDAYIDKLYCELTINEEIVRRFWVNNPALFTPLPMKRLIKVTMWPAGTASSATGALREMGRVLTGGDVPEETEVAETDDSGEVLFSEEVTTATKTVVGPEPGGAGPSVPAAGGEPARQVADVPPSTAHHPPSSVYSESASHGPHGSDNWHATTLAPLAIAEQDETPSEYCPPPVGVLRRCDPDCYYKRFSPSEFREIVKSYSSSEFVMRYDDLGFLYVEDRADIPKAINHVPSGAYSSPKAAGTTAVAYYVEEERRLPKPRFDEIKTRVYSTYRDTEVDKKLQQVFKGAVQSSRVQFSLDKQITGEK